MTTINPRNLLTRGRTLLILLFIGALSAWGGLLLFTYYVQPRGALAISVVFVLLTIALDCTCTLLVYLISWLVLAARSRHPRMSQVLREGGLTTAWLVFNLFLSTFHNWSLFTTVVSFGIIVVIELLVLVRV